jgi:hypothetical protein
VVVEEVSEEEEEEASKTEKSSSLFAGERRRSSAMLSISVPLTIRERSSSNHPSKRGLLSRRSLFEVIEHSYNKFIRRPRRGKDEIFQLEFSLMFAIHSSQCTALGVAWHWWLGGPVKSNYSKVLVVVWSFVSVLSYSASEAVIYLLL